MDLLEASAQLERIELLAKIAHVYESNQREKQSLWPGLVRLLEKCMKWSEKK